jgi:hypothetical protein
MHHLTGSLGNDMATSLQLNHSAQPTAVALCIELRVVHDVNASVAESSTLTKHKRWTSCAHVELAASSRIDSIHPMRWFTADHHIHVAYHL